MQLGVLAALMMEGSGVEQLGLCFFIPSTFVIPVSETPNDSHQMNYMAIHAMKIIDLRYMNIFTIITYWYFLCAIRE